MGKPANKARGEVALPEVGEGVLIRFTVDALERLEGAYDNNEKGWLLTVLDGLSGKKMSVIKACIECSAVDHQKVDFSKAWNIDALSDKILDGLFLILYDKTFAEQKAIEEQKQMDEVSRRMKEISADPHLAALVSLEQSAKLATNQG
ncbi:hypothetical protein NKJ09_22720 [Mesorhizobium sp. M0189]|uniref:hypothetical protein n=1 Tax=Mesorhizobium sp. M0189 TaxID=2956909 RepID=UPI00333DAE33